MGAPWKRGQRHQSWAANTNLATVAFAIVFVTYVAWSLVSVAPPGLTTLLGVAGGAWFGAISDDRRRREEDLARTADRADHTADRAETKVDRLTEVAEKQHPGSTEGITEVGEQE